MGKGQGRGNGKTYPKAKSTKQDAPTVSATSLFGLSPLTTGVLPQMGAQMGMMTPFGMPQMGMAASQLNPFSSTAMPTPTTTTEQSALQMMLLQQQFAGGAQGVDVTLTPTEQFYIAGAIREKQKREHEEAERQLREKATGLPLDYLESVAKSRSPKKDNSGKRKTKKKSRMEDESDEALTSVEPTPNPTPTKSSKRRDRLADKLNEAKKDAAKYKALVEKMEKHLPDRHTASDDDSPAKSTRSSDVGKRLKALLALAKQEVQEEMGEEFEEMKQFAEQLRAANTRRTKRKTTLENELAAAEDDSVGTKTNSPASAVALTAATVRSNFLKQKVAMPSKTQMGFNTPAKTADALLESLQGAMLRVREVDPDQQFDKPVASQLAEMDALITPLKAVFDRAVQAQNGKLGREPKVYETKFRGLMDHFNLKKQVGAREGIESLLGRVTLACCVCEVDLEEDALCNDLLSGKQ